MPVVPLQKPDELQIPNPSWMQTSPVYEDMDDCMLFLMQVISTLLLVGVVFIPIGIVSLFASQDVVEIVNEYETECIPIESRNDKPGYIQGLQDKTFKTRPAIELSGTNWRSGCGSKCREFGVESSYDILGF